MTMTKIRPSLGIVFAVLVSLKALASQALPAPKSISLEQLPVAVQETLKDKAKGAIIQRISQSPVTYTARFDTSGQKSELRITDAGKVLRPHSKQEAEALFEEGKRQAHDGKLATIDLKDVPSAAREAIAEMAKGVKLDQIVRAAAVFTAIASRSGEMSEIRIADDGTFLAETRR